MDVGGEAGSGADGGEGQCLKFEARLGKWRLDLIGPEASFCSKLQ